MNFSEFKKYTRVAFAAFVVFTVLGFFMPVKKIANELNIFSADIQNQTEIIDESQSPSVKEADSNANRMENEKKTTKYEIGDDGYIRLFYKNDGFSIDVPKKWQKGKFEDSLAAYKATLEAKTWIIMNVYELEEGKAYGEKQIDQLLSDFEDSQVNKEENLKLVVESREDVECEVKRGIKLNGELRDSENCYNATYFCFVNNKNLIVILFLNSDEKVDYSEVFDHVESTLRIYNVNSNVFLSSEKKDYSEEKKAENLDNQNADEFKTVSNSSDNSNLTVNESKSQSENNTDKYKIVYPPLMQLFIDIESTTTPSQMESMCDEKSIYYHNYNFIESGGSDHSYYYTISSNKAEVEKPQPYKADYINIHFKTDDDINYYIDEMTYWQHSDDYGYYTASRQFIRPTLVGFRKKEMWIYAYKITTGLSGYYECQSPEEAMYMVFLY